MSAVAVLRALQRQHAVEDAVGRNEERAEQQQKHPLAPDRANGGEKIVICFSGTVFLVFEMC